MDFTGQFAFPNGQQAFPPFMTMPPLTPSHSQSVPSDDYSNSPPVSAASRPNQPHFPPLPPPYLSITHQQPSVGPAQLA